MVTALRENWTFDRLHGILLDYFVPRRLFDQLRRERYDRLQAENESFAAYVISVKEADVVLRLPVSELEIVCNIIAGLSPIQRSRFVFLKSPTNFTDLEWLAILDQNFAFADQMQQLGSGAGPTTVPSKVNTLQQDSAAHSVRQHATVSYSKPSVRCFWFNKMGHLQKDCRVILTQPRKPRPSVRLTNL